ncbi:MAG: TraM recognition domain-containing protein [Nocardioidaceae bacterium]
MVVIDEFQDFVGALDFGDVLAQARGLGVSITAAHQHLRQLALSLRAAVLANARSRLVFRPAHDDAKALADVLGETVTAGRPRTAWRLPGGRPGAGQECAECGLRGADLAAR